jgi:hypothetical protein
MRRSIAVTLLLWPALIAQATVRIQDEAKKAGYAAASDCAYCHSFGSDHMREKAHQMRIHNYNCVRCHGNHLPKMGAALYSERGLWLVQQKTERQAQRVDVGWLKDYVEKEKPKK